MKPLAANALLIMTATAIAGWAGHELRQAEPPGWAELPAALELEPELSSRPRRSYQALLSHSLLVPHSARNVVPVKPMADPAIKRAPSLQSILKIIGVFACSDPAKSILVVETLADRAQKMLKKGDEIRGIQVIQITPQIRLRYEEEDYFARFTPGDQGSSDGDAAWTIVRDISETEEPESPSSEHR